VKQELLFLSNNAIFLFVPFLLVTILALITYPKSKSNPIWLLTLLHNLPFCFILLLTCLHLSPLPHPAHFISSPTLCFRASCPPLFPFIRGVRLPHWLWRGGTGECSVWHGDVQSLRRAHWRGGNCWHGVNFWLRHRTLSGLFSLLSHFRL